MIWMPNLDKPNGTWGVHAMNPSGLHVQVRNHKRASKFSANTMYMEVRNSYWPPFKRYEIKTGAVPTVRPTTVCASKALTSAVRSR